MAKVATKDISGNVLTINFANGEKLVADILRMSPEIRDRLAMHGLSQKLGDAYASAESVAEAAGNAQEAWENLLRGDWATRATGGILAEALSRAAGRTVEECREVLRTMDEKKKRELAKSSPILDAIAAIRAERAKGSTIDLAALF